MTDEHPPRTFKEQRSRNRAYDNVDKWGQQSVSAILASIQEEWGELVDEAIPPHRIDSEEGSVIESWRLLRGASHGGNAMRKLLESESEDPEGRPKPKNERAMLTPEREDIDPEQLREELYDLMALCYQLDWAIYQGNYERDRWEDDE